MRDRFEKPRSVRYLLKGSFMFQNPLLHDDAVTTTRKDLNDSLW